MATLNTNQSQLANVQRQRNLADALTQQAISAQPIVSPFQGLAKLAQALVANQVRKSADETESSAEKRRVKALQDALAPVTESAIAPDRPVAMESLEGEPTLGSLPGRRFTRTRPKNPQERLTALAGTNPELAESIVGQVTLQDTLFNSGLLPGQINPRDTRSTLEKEFTFAKRDGGFTGTLEDFIKLKRSGGITINTGEKLPNGFRWVDESDHSKGVVPITGGPADPTVLQSPEAAAKQQLLATALSSSEEFQKFIVNEDGSINRTNIFNAMLATPFTEGRQANVFLLDSIEAKLRAESGAAVPETEVKRAGRRFRPSPLDNDATVRTKVELLGDFLEGAFNRTQAGEFDVDGTLKNLEAAAEARLRNLGVQGFDTTQVEGWELLSPQQQDQLADYVMGEIAKGNNPLER